MGRFFLVFLVIVALTFGLALTPLGQAWLVVPFTSAVARVSAILIQAFDPGVQSQGKVIWDTASGFGVSIEAGCNGVEAGIILAAAMLAFPATWRQKLIGIAIGLISIQAMNLARIISLFYLGQWNQTLFEWAHLYIWQALIMLDVLVVFLLWLHWLARRPGTPPSSPTTPAV